MDLLRIRELPFLTRRNYLFEFRHLLAWGAMAGLIEGTFGSVVVAKTFGGNATLISIAVSTPMAAFLFSIGWGILCVGRPKVRLLSTLASGVVLLMGTIALIPRTSTGAIWFIAQMATAQVLFAGIVTVRSGVWKSNYPVQVRGKITARLQGVRMVVSTVATLLAAGLFDRDPGAYRYVYPVAALLGLVSLRFLNRIRVRGEARELAGRTDAPRAAGPRDGIVEPFTLMTVLSPGHVFGRMVDILRTDRRFAAYMTAQFFLGMANILPRGVVVVLLTRELDLGFHRVFWTTMVLTDVLPKVLVLGSLRPWGRLFDRVGVVRFRVVNSCFWALSLLFGLAGTMCLTSSRGHGGAMLPWAVALFALYAIAYGVGRGGGALAWNIGHLHFAHPRRAEMYMGLHVSLTGIRGLTMPVLGVWIWAWIGWGVWIVALACITIAFGVFLTMARREVRRASIPPAAS